MTTIIAETIRQFQTGQNHERNKQTVKSSNMPQKLSERTRLVVNRYGDGECFAKKFNPSLQVVCAQNVERSFKGNAPSLALSRSIYLSQRKDGAKTQWHSKVLLPISCSMIPRPSFFINPTVSYYLIIGISRHSSHSSSQFDVSTNLVAAVGMNS